MYKISKDGEIISICDEPRYIRIKEETGAFVEATEEDADGVAVNGVAYNFIGSTKIPDAEQVVIVYLGDGITYLWKELNETNVKNAELEASNDMLTECILEMSEIIYG